MEDDGNNTNTETSFVSSFPMEMSQDCIVWDESKNRDLREIAISPPNDNVMRPNNTSRLDSIKRRLGASSEQEVDAVFRFLAEEEEEGNGNDENSLLTTQPTENTRNVRPRVDIMQPPRNKMSSLASRRNRKKERTTSITTKTMEAQSRRRRKATTATTPTTIEPGLFASPVPTSANAHKNSSSTASDGAFEELLKEFSTPQSSEKKDQSPEPRMTATHDMPPTPLPLRTQTITPPNLPPPTTAAATTTTSTTTNSAPPMVPPSRNNTILPIVAKENPYSRSTVPIARTANQHHRPPLQSKNAFNSTTTSRPNRATMPPPLKPTKPSTTMFEQQPPTSKHTIYNGTAPKNKNNNYDVDDSFSDFDFGDIANLDSLLSMKSSTQAILAKPALGNTSATSAVPAAVPTTGTKRTTTNPPTTNQDDDEFGDFPNVDLEALDAVSAQHNVTTKTKGDELIKSTNRNASSIPAAPATAFQEDDEFGAFPDVDFEAMDAVAAQKNVVPAKTNDDKTRKATTATIPAPAKAAVAAAPRATTNQDDDEFGEFPDVDFEAMDEVVTQKTRSISMSVEKEPSVPCKEQSAGEDEFGDFPDMDFDVMDQVIQQRSTIACHLPPNAAVQNPRRTTAEDSLSFITFTRYKILEVVDDNSSYTKSLLVACWTEDMRKELELEKEFHRNCQVTVAQDSTNLPEDSSSDSSSQQKSNGLVHLRGEWYHTPVFPGDVVHLCSVSGRFRTDADALPIILHNPAPPGSDNDDLVLVIHPDILMTPTTISETVTCSRRAVLKSRIGSTGLTNKAALFGTMRHDLFGACMRQANFDLAFAKRIVHKLVRQNAEELLGCGVSTAEAQGEILSVFPVIRNFVQEYTALGKLPNPELLDNAIKIAGHGYQSNIKFLTHKVHSIEEPIISPELALKGNVDAILEVNTLELNDKSYVPNAVQNPVPQHSLMCLELKTGHNQKPQNVHMAQLALYTLMLQSRYGVQQTRPDAHLHGISDPNGASAGGILLYLNQKGTCSAHVSPLLNEQKSLVGQRNIVASGMHRASRPRGVVLSYGDDTRSKEKQTPTATLLPPPPADLPEVLSNSYSCQRCYVNRECMLYAAAGTKKKNDPNWATGRSHGDLLAQFTGHLQESDIEYFRTWDRLIDLEADASGRNIAIAWLTDSRCREMERGESISGLVFDHPEPSPTDESSHVLIAFRRGGASLTQTSFEKISLTRGCHVIISTDGTSLVDGSSGLDSCTAPSRRIKKFRHQMHIVRGIVENVQNEKLLVMARREELERIRDLVIRHRNFCDKNGEPYSPLSFRFDKDTSSVGIGTLRQNLINFFTADFSGKKDEQLSQASAAKKLRLPKLRDLVIRLEKPRFDINVSVELLFRSVGQTIPGCDMKGLSTEFSQLNPDQRQAVMKVVSTNDYTLMQGLPGTGKTTTLAYIARLLAARGKRVLITSYTHAAVDNVVLKLMDTGVASVNEATKSPVLVRIGQKSSCHTKVRPLLAAELALQLDRTRKDKSEATMHTLSQSESYQNFENPSVESLKNVVGGARIVCSSALSVPRSPLLMHENFDVVIIDEAGQISQPAILGAIVAADSFVLVGDHKQLPPLVTSQLAEAGGYGVSIFQRLAEKHPKAIASLTHQYRMNMTICRLSSEAVYGGRLKCGSEEVKDRTLQMAGFPKSLPQASSKTAYPWLKAVLDPQRSVVFVDTDNVKKDPRPVYERRSYNENGVGDSMEALEGTLGGNSRGSVINQTEVSLIRIIIRGLLSCGVAPTSVGVISPFRAQLQILEEDSNIASWKGDGLELSTIDRYQGRDKDVVILSTVRSNIEGKVGRLLLDMRRLNVALTRAKSKLIIVGSFSTLSRGSDPLRPLLGRVNKRGQRFLLPENAVQCYNI